MNIGWRTLQKTLVPTRPIGPCTIVTTSQRNRYRIPHWARFRGPAERIAVTSWRPRAIAIACRTPSADDAGPIKSSGGPTQSSSATHHS